MLNLTRIRFKNILSFGNTWTEINFEDRKSVLIQGDNGSGKSACILDTISFGLYGRPFRKISKNKLINYRNRREMVVEIWFKDDSGTEYHIIRGLNPQVFEIYKDGTLIDQTASVRDYQTILEKQVLKIDFQSFTQIVILGKATYVAFLRLSMQDRRRFIEHVLALTIFSKMNEVNKSRLLRIKQSIEALRHEIDLLNNEYNLIDGHIKDFEVESQRMQLEHQTSIDDEVASIKDDIEQLIAKRQTLVESSNGADVEDKLSALSANLDRCYEFSAKIGTKLKGVQKRKRFFENNSVCPTCESPLESDVRESKCRELSDKESELASAQEKLNAKTRESVDAVSEVQTELNGIREAQQKIGIIEHEISGKTKSIESLNGRRILPKFNQDLLDEKKTNLAEVTTRRDEKYSLRASLGTDLDSYEFISAMLKDTGIKSMIIKRRIPKIEQVMNEFLRSLGLFVRFELNENFEETLFARGIDKIVYHGFSEGEKLRIDLAMLMTWRELCKLQSNMAVNFLIFDEILDASLDEGGVESLLGLFKVLSDEGTKVVVISHSASRWEDKFDECWHVEKSNGFSKILMGGS